MGLKLLVSCDHHTYQIGVQLNRRYRPNKGEGSQIKENENNTFMFQSTEKLSSVSILMDNFKCFKFINFFRIMS